jgi:hypothetical protein
MSKQLPRESWERHVRTNVLHIGRICNTLKSIGCRDWWADRAPILATWIMTSSDNPRSKVRRLCAVRKEALRVLLKYTIR